VGRHPVHDRHRLRLIWFANLEALGGTTSLLLLCVFTIVNIAVLVLRKDPVEHDHFHARRSSRCWARSAAPTWPARSRPGRRRLPHRRGADGDRRRPVGVTSGVQRYVLHEDVAPTPTQLDAPKL
jgi:hypothetical protein